MNWHLATVVQFLDTVIRRIKQYPVDKSYGNQLQFTVDSDLSGR